MITNCHDLAYASQNEDKMARLNRKMRDLRTRVGADDEDVIYPFPEKPKGMHLETLLRLEQKDFEANKEKMRILSGQISALEAEIWSCLQTWQRDEFGGLLKWMTELSVIRDLPRSSVLPEVE